MDSSAFQSIWLVLGLPLAAFLVLALFGKRIEGLFGRKVVGALAVLPITLSFGLGLMLTQNLTKLDAASRSIVVHGPSWIDLIGFKVPFEFIVDPLSMTMVLIITGIGALIFLYSTGYMAEERDYSRFFTYLNLFVASMLILVLGNNLLLLFIGWEGVGLCSYLLIGFWYEDVANARAANKAFIVNRIGDWALLLGLFLIVIMAATAKTPVADGRMLSYDVLLPVLAKTLNAQPLMATTIGLLLFVGACGKSAQFPLYLWLPDAMAGPTPVSALIHAATMVTSGVVLLNRMNVVYQLSTVASAVICVVGAFTAVFAAVIAFGQTDIKKVLAYSTVSQLGFMFIGCGSGAYWTGMFHVTTHAFFKALLFLGAGAVIHAMAHNQDMRNYGKLYKYLPITFCTMLIGTLAIAGVPGFSGFYSKEAILGSALANEQGVIGTTNLSYIAGWIGLIVAALTAMYMTRLTCLTFLGKDERWRAIPAEIHEDGEHDHGRHELDQSHTPHEVKPSMWFPLVVLAVLSAGAGYILHKNEMFKLWLQPTELTLVGVPIKLEPQGIHLTQYSLIAAGSGIVLGLLVYLRGLPKREGFDETKWSSIRLWARDQFGYDRAMTSMAVEGGDQAANILWKFFDVSIVDGVVNGLAGLAGAVGKGAKLVQTGFVRTYALLMLVGVALIIGYFTYLSAAADHIVGGR